MANPQLSSIVPVLPNPSTARSARMRYRHHPVSVAVDPVSLIVSECLAITSALQRYSRIPQSSVSVILGGSSNTVIPTPPGPSTGRRRKSPFGNQERFNQDGSLTSRWSLRGEPLKSSQDSTLIIGFAKLRQELSGVNGRSFHRCIGSYC